MAGGGSRLRADSTTTKEETKEEGEEEEEEEEEEEQADIKSNNPHLTGGEQRILLTGAQDTESISFCG